MLTRADQGLNELLNEKTSQALSQWSQYCGYPICWVSLDEGDNDLARFWGYVIASLRRQEAHVAEGLQLQDQLQLLQPFSQLPPVESLLAMIVNGCASASRDLVLVLDDYEVVTSQAIHKALDYFLDHLPSQVHVVIASRINPPLSLARIRARRQLMELEASDLSFTPEESATFLNGVMDLGLSAEDLSVVSKRVEGWIVGLQLIALSMQGGDKRRASIRAFKGDHRYFQDYLTEEVLSRQQADVKRFLLQTCIVDRLCGPLCDALTGQCNSQAMLERLERANLFTLPMDAERRWYRYHHLFADALRAYLQLTEPEQVGLLNSAACVWYAENGMSEEAVGHALAAREFDLAADLIERVFEALRKRGEAKTMVSWLKALPEEVIRDRPKLCVAHVWALNFTRQMEAANARLRDLERHVRPDGDDLPSATEGDREGEATVADPLRAEVLLARAFAAVYQGDTQRSINLCRQGLNLISETDWALWSRFTWCLGFAYKLSGDATRASEALLEVVRYGRQSGQVNTVVESLNELAGLQAAQGQLRLAAGTYRQALEIQVAQGNPHLPSAGVPHLGLARIHYEWNDLETAANLCREGTELSRLADNVGTLPHAYGVMARIKQALGDVEGAILIAEQGEELARAKKLVPLVSRLAAYKAHLWVRQGNLEAAKHWALEPVLPVDHGPDYLFEAEYRTLAELKLAQGQSDEAVALLERLLGNAEAAQRMSSVIKVLVLQATALQTCGDEEGAIARLARALSLSEPEGYVRTFVDAGAPVAGLMARLLRLGRDGHLGKERVTLSYVHGLLSAFGRYAASPGRGGQDKALPPYRDLLTEREVEVLRLVAAGQTVSEIAKQLVVAESTVKTHIKNIYVKLGAHNRVSVIARGRELKLLS